MGRFIRAENRDVIKRLWRDARADREYSSLSSCYFCIFSARKIRNTNIEARNKYKIPILNDQHSSHK